MLCAPGSRRGEYALSYSSDNDPSSLAVDAEGQMARFVMNASKAKKLTHSNHSISANYSNTFVNYCNTFTYFHVMCNVFGAALTDLSQLHIRLFKFCICNISISVIISILDQ